MGGQENCFKREGFPISICILTKYQGFLLIPMIPTTVKCFIRFVFRLTRKWIYFERHL